MKCKMRVKLFTILFMIGFAGLSGGCTQAMMDATMAQSVNEAKASHRETRQVVSAHDDNMTGQHQAMSPEVADEIALIRAEFTVALDAANARAEAIKSEALMHLTAAAKEMAVRFAGMPPNMPIWNTIESAVSGQPGVFDDLGIKDLLAALGIGGMGVGAARLGKSRGASDLARVESKVDAMKPT